MNSPYDDDPDFDPHELLRRQEIALVDARARVAFSEHELARLAKTYPEIAALRLPVSEYTVADLRTDQLNEVLGRINAALGLTGEEQDYWLKLWAYALSEGWVVEAEFGGITREELAARIDTGFPNVQAVQVGFPEQQIVDGPATKTVGRPRVACTIDSELVKKLREDTPQTVFARMCGVSVDVLQRAEKTGVATRRTIRGICRAAKAKGNKIKPDQLIKNTPQ